MSVHLLAADHLAGLISAFAGVAAGPAKSFEDLFWQGIFALSGFLNFITEFVDELLPFPLLVFNGLALALTVVALIVAGVGWFLARPMARLFGDAEGALVRIGVLLFGAILAALDLRLRSRYGEGIVQDFSDTIVDGQAFMRGPLFSPSTGGNFGFLPLWFFGLFSVSVATSRRLTEPEESLFLTWLAPIVATVGFFLAAAWVVAASIVVNVDLGHLHAERLGGVSFTRSPGIVYAASTNHLGQIAILSALLFAILQWQIPSALRVINFAALAALFFAVDLGVRAISMAGPDASWANIFNGASGGQILFTPLWMVSLLFALLFTSRWTINET